MKTPMRAHSPPINCTLEMIKLVMGMVVMIKLVLGMVVVMGGHGDGGADHGVYEDASRQIGHNCPGPNLLRTGSFTLDSFGICSLVELCTVHGKFLLEICHF